MTPPAPFPLGKRVALLGSVAGAHAFDKPAGTLTHPNRPGEEGRSLLHAAYDPDAERYHWRDEGGQARELHLVHRLDSPTSGVVLAAETAELAETLKRVFAERRADKEYVAVLKGILDPPEQTWRDHLVRERRGGHLRVRRGGSRPAVTHVERTDRSRKPLRLSRVRMEPRTGRTHQLRVQAALRDAPIVGDTTYGDFPFNKTVRRQTGLRRLLLHARRLSLRWQHEGEAHEATFTSPVPEAFERALRGERGRGEGR